MTSPAALPLFSSPSLYPSPPSHPLSSSLLSISTRLHLCLRWGKTLTRARLIEAGWTPSFSPRSTVSLWSQAQNCKVKELLLHIHLSEGKEGKKKRGSLCFRPGWWSGTLWGTERLKTGNPEQTILLLILVSKSTAAVKNCICKPTWITLVKRYVYILHCLAEMCKDFLETMHIPYRREIWA